MSSLPTPPSRAHASSGGGDACYIPEGKKIKFSFFGELSPDSDQIEGGFSIKFFSPDSANYVTGQRRWPCGRRSLFYTEEYNTIDRLFKISSLDAGRSFDADYWFCTINNNKNNKDIC